MSDCDRIVNNFRLIEHFLLRRAGFPFHLIEQLEAPQSAAWARRVVLYEGDVANLRHQLLVEGLPAEVAICAEQGDRARLRALSRLRHCIGHGREPRAEDTTLLAQAETLGPLLSAWMASKQQAEAAREELQSCIRTEYSAGRFRLREFLARPDIMEALFLLSPDFFEAACRWREHAQQEISSTRERSFEQRLFLFLQRLAAKNETTSFFGPLTYGLIDHGVDQWTFGPETPTGIVLREAFIAFWAVSALCRAACQEDSLRRLLPVRRLGVASVRGRQAYMATGQTGELDMQSAQLFQELTSPTPVADLAMHLGLSFAECERLVRKLEHAGLVRRDLEPPSAEAHPLQAVRAQLPQGEAGDRWRRIFDDFARLAQRFAGAQISERPPLLAQIESTFQNITGEAPRRNPGRMYADRLVLYEDCAGDMQPVRCPAPEARRIERELAPILRLGAAYGELRHQAIRTLASRVLMEPASPMPFLTFAEAIDDATRQAELEALLKPATAFLERLQQLVAPHADSEVVCLDPDEIDALIACESTGRAVSLDLMFERRPGAAPQIVLGEAHPYVFAWGSQALFAPEKSALLSTFAQDLSPWGGEGRMATVLRRRQHKGLVTNDFPGRFIEISARASTSAHRSIAIADVVVVAGKNGPLLQTLDGEELVLYAGENDHLHLRAFAPAQIEMPLMRCGDHTPRIQIGDVVYQRQRWEIAAHALRPLAEAESPVDLAIEVARQREISGWPRYLFAKSATEPKPICLDLNVPLAQITLKKLLQSQALTLIEMFPRPQALWLQRDTGLHTSELRVQLVL